MSISDRLEQIEARRAQANSSLNGRHMLVGKDVPEVLDALRAVLDVCDREIAEPWSQETDQLARNASDAIATALGEGQ